jgi:hypothetical protein
MKFTLRTAAAFLLAVSAIFQTLVYAADNSQNQDYYRIKSKTMSLTEADSGKEVSLERPALIAPVSTIHKDAAAATAIVNTGIAAWNVVNDGAPSGSASSSYASAIPPDWVFQWSSVDGWKGPKEVVYTYTVTNLYNVDVIKVKYVVSFYYGGTENGSIPGKVKGKYITNFTVKALEMNVIWGWHFNLDVRMSNPMNIGTKLNPVAFLQSDLNWTISTPFATESGIRSCTVDGNGNYKDLTEEEQTLTKGIQTPTKSEAPSVSWN